MFGPGVATAFNANGWKVSQRGAGANMSVDIAAGDGLLNLPTGGYGFWGWTTATENVSVTNANPTNPRIDVVVAWVDTSVTTTASANSPNALKFSVMAGTPAGSPVAMNDATIQSTLGSSVAWIKLATFTVAAGSTSVVNANITDVRTGITGLANSAVADSSVTTAKLADTSVTPAKLQAGTGTSWAWQSHTPSFTNFTLGNGTINHCKYSVVGKQVTYRGRVTLGNTSAMGASLLGISLPVTAASNYLADDIIGTAIVIDAGIQLYLGSGQIVDNATMCIRLNATASGTNPVFVVYRNVLNGTPITYGMGDSFGWTVTYEAA